MKFLIAFSIVTFFCTGCTLYESTGHEIIQENKAGIVTGESSMNSMSYVCQNGPETPEFLKEPWEVIETPHELNDYSVLYNSQSELPQVIVYRAKSDNKNTPYCKMNYHDKNITSQRILDSTVFAIDILEKF